MKRNYRLELINYLGPSCRICNLADIRVLQIDFINGDHSYQMDRRRGNVYRYYCEHKEETRGKLQVLCANHNWLKRCEKKEYCSDRTPSYQVDYEEEAVRNLSITLEESADYLERTLCLEAYEALIKDTKIPENLRLIAKKRI